MTSVNTFNGVFPRPPPGKRPDYLPKRRPGTRYRRPNSLPPIEVTNKPDSKAYESARSCSNREQQYRTESLDNTEETTAKSHTRRHDQHLQDGSVVVRHTKKRTKKKQSSWAKNAGHPLPNAEDDTFAIWRAKRLMEEDNPECANQHIVERCEVQAAELHVDVDTQCQLAAYTEKTDVDESDYATKEMELECEEKGNGDDKTLFESKNKYSNDDSDGVGKAASTTCASVSSMQRSVSVQVPDEDMNLDELVPQHKRVEVMIINPVIGGQYAAISEESRFTNTTEIAFLGRDCEVGNLKTPSGLKTRMEDDKNHPTPHASKPTDWDNVSISAIVELEMMKEDFEERIVENLEKLGRLLNLETRHNGKDHSAMEREVAALVSLFKEEMDASDDNEDDYHRMSDLDEEYDYWKINSGVLIWSPPSRLDEKSGVVPHKKISQCPTLESIKEEDNSESDSEENSECDTEAGNQAKQVERGEHQLKDHAATGTLLCSNPSKVVKATMPTCCTSLGVGTAVDGFSDMLSSAIISNAIQRPPDRNNMQGSSSKRASVIETSRDRFGLSSSETMCEQKESATQSEPVNSLLEPATTSPEYTVNQAVNSSDSQCSPLADSATSTGTTVTVVVPAKSNTCNISVILTSPSDENLGVTAEPSEKTEIYSAPTLHCAPMRPCTADENERKIASSPTLKSSAMKLKTLSVSSTCESTKIARSTRESEEEIDDNDDDDDVDDDDDDDDDDDTSCKAVYHSSQSEVSNDKDVANKTSMKKVKWSDLQFPSTDGSATLTGSTDTCNTSVILTSPSNETLCVTVEPSENLEINSAPTLNSTPTRSSYPADERQILSAPTLIPSAMQLKQVKRRENWGAKVAKTKAENEEVNLVRGLIPSSVTASAIFDGGNTTPTPSRLDDDDNKDKNKMVHYSRSGKEVCIPPATTNRELGLRSENPTTEVAEENGTGKSPTRKRILRKAKKSLSTFRSCDLKESNNPHDRRSKAERLEPFRAASEPDTALEDGKIVLHRVHNADIYRSINKLRKSSAGTNIIPEEFAKKKNGYFPRDKLCWPTCDGTLVKRGSCKSASKAGKYVSSLSESDSCAQTCDGKTLKTRSRNPASENTCKHEAESVGKNKRRNSKNNPRYTVGKTRKIVDATQSLVSEVHASNDKVTAKPSCRLQKSSHQLVSGTSNDSVEESCQSKCSSSFLPQIPSYNYHKKSSFSLLSVDNGLSVKQVSLPSIASTGQITEERSPLKLPTIKSATIRVSSDANKASHSAKHKQAVLKAKSSIGGFALPSKVSKNEIANGLEQKRADRLGMSTGHAIPNSSEASGKLASASVKVNQNFGAATLGHEMVLEQSISVQEMSSRSRNGKNHDKLPPLKQPETISLPKIPLTSDGQGLDGTAWIRANRDIILRQASRKNVPNHHRKTEHRISDRDKLPQIHLKRENRSLPQMLQRPPWC